MSQPFIPGSLWPQVRQTFERALEIGALQPIPTHFEWVEEDGIRFLVRQVDNLRRKELAQARRDQGLSTTQKKDQNFNPFLPYEEDLFVCDLTPSHLVLLNKFNVMDHHILIVTREFEEQSSWLNQNDFEAFQLAAREMDGLGFYNAGTLAGASQRHKHLQLVPTPLVEDGPKLPFSPWIDAAVLKGISNAPELTFRHAIAPLHEHCSGSALFESYCQLMEMIDMGNPRSETDSTGAYNLLMTRQWMMAVPRSQEKYDKISINSLGFSGAMLVKKAEQLEQLKTLGPMSILTAVGVEHSNT